MIFVFFSICFVQLVPVLHILPETPRDPEKTKAANQFDRQLHLAATYFFEYPEHSRVTLRQRQFDHIQSTQTRKIFHLLQ